MRAIEDRRDGVAPVGIGYYTVPEAARLLQMHARTINRWLGGYVYSDNGVKVSMAPLWTPQLPHLNGHLELGFRDLIELRFVNAFIKAGLGLNTINGL